MIRLAYLLIPVLGLAPPLANRGRTATEGGLAMLHAQIQGVPNLPGVPPPPSQRSPFPIWLFNWVWIIPVFIYVQREQKKKRKEEESQTPYTEDDLMNDWEFKILRDPLNRLSRQSFRARVLEEEGRSGWQLVELFDAGRMRLKRPASQRTGDGLVGSLDPYRAVLSAPKGYNLMILGGILGAIASVVLIICLFAALGGSQPIGGPDLWLGLGSLLAIMATVYCFLQARQKARQ